MTVANYCITHVVSARVHFFVRGLSMDRACNCQTGHMQNEESYYIIINDMSTLMHM